jgi:RimJ/RimL family protein N-acetyltransferase
MTDQPILKGEKTVLRPLTEADVPLQARWFFDPDVLHWLQLSEDPASLRTQEAVRARFERMQADPRTKVWRIDTYDGRPIGEIELVNIHPVHKRAEIHLLIGEKEFWSHGYGSDAIRTLLGYAFGELGMRRIYLIPDRDNLRAIRSYEKCGFMQEGVLRAQRLRYGEPVDMVLMAILREDYLDMQLRK